MLQGLEFCGALVGGHNFEFTGTEGCLFLADEFPCNWSARAADEKTRERERNLNSSRGVPYSNTLLN